MDLRKYTCRECWMEFWVDCDASDYPNLCPYCGADEPEISTISVKVDANYED
ncbi:MAG: hypothetical protein AB7D36_11150 [Oscillospiraceae bacterium]